MIRLFLISTLLLFCLSSWGQRPQRKELFCQGCCACVGSYYLELMEGNDFEIYYALYPNGKKKEVTTYGVGKYKIENEILELSFEQLKETKYQVVKTQASDSVIVTFKEIFDNVFNDTLYSFIEVNRTGRKISSHTEQYMYPPYIQGNLSQELTIRKPFKGKTTFTISPIIYKQLNIEITEPGYYTVVASIAPLADKIQLKPLKFRILKTEEGTTVKGLDNQLKFSSISCRCN